MKMKRRKLLFSALVCMVAACAVFFGAGGLNTKSADAATSVFSLKTYQGQDNFYYLSGSYQNNSLTRMIYFQRAGSWYGENSSTMVNNNQLQTSAEGKDSITAYVVGGSGLMTIAGTISNGVGGGQTGLNIKIALRKAADAATGTSGTDTIIYSGTMTNGSGGVSLDNVATAKDFEVGAGDILFFVASQANGTSGTGGSANFKDLTFSYKNYTESSGSYNAPTAGIVSVKSGSLAITNTNDVMDASGFLVHYVTTNNASVHQKVVSVSSGNIATMTYNENGTMPFYYTSGVASVAVDWTNQFVSNAPINDYSGVMYTAAVAGKINIGGAITGDAGKGYRVAKVSSAGTIGAEIASGSCTGAGNLIYLEDITALQNIELAQGESVLVLSVCGPWANIRMTPIFDFIATPVAIDSENVDFDADPVSASYAGGNLTISAAVPAGGSSQIWVKENVTLQGGNNAVVWSLKSGYADADSYTATGAFAGGNDSVSALIRIKDDGGNITESYRVFKSESYIPKIYSITSGAQNYSLNEVIRLPKNNAALDILTYGIVPASISIYDGAAEIVQSSNGSFNIDFGFVGAKTLAVDMGDTIELINVVVYDNSTDYAYISDVEESVSASGVTLTPTIIKAGDQTAEYTAQISVGGRQAVSGTELALTSDGYYAYTVTLKDALGVQIDSYSKVVKFGADLESISLIAANPATEKDTQVTVGQQTATPGMEYMFIKWDAKGEYVVQSYTEGASTYDFTPYYTGIYKFEMRVRSIGSGATYEDSKMITVNVGGVSAAVAEVLVGGNGLRSVNTVTVSGITADDAMYSFILHSDGLYLKQQAFSPSGTFCFVPYKPGEYTIEVRIIYGGSYGYGDTVKYTQKITV